MIHDVIYEEREPLYNAACFSPDEALDERGFVAGEATVVELWLRPVELSAQERCDEDYLHDLDPDWEPGDPTPTHVCVGARPGEAGAARFLRVVGSPVMKVVVSGSRDWPRDEEDPP